ncbi:rab effector MyRIP [Perognathus longimembris pacificus]|uniref:rab effector MyRIP n=1 Tax=Perognathus longimembris pacificus TaxID=214514 RepID=UPI002019D4E2|nr:rab effector MyRIP [Perognathus longimembris pacificus]
MGRKLDLSALTDDETDHVLQVVQRDFNLRKKEEERLSEMKQKLEEEGSKCSILSKHPQFVAHCCMRCCAPFTFLVNPKRLCGDCRFNVCRNCSLYHKHEKAWLCGVCQQARLLRAQSLEWFYNNVKTRFKRFGSAKVLKNLYRKHRLETGSCFDLIGGSLLESSLENEGSISGSDSTFYQQSEGHNMMDALAVALRVAEEAIEEAISKAEAHGDSLDKQNEASYLRGHREELTEELASTILQKIIRRQKSKSHKQEEDEAEWPPSPSGSAKAPDKGGPAAPRGHQGPAPLERSQSAFSLARGEAASGPPGAGAPPPGAPPTWPSWRSLDGLDGAGAAQVLQSSDGNWVAVAGGPPPRARRLVTPKGGSLRALEAASSVPSVYEEMAASDSEEDLDWGDASSKPYPKPSGPPQPGSPAAGLPPPPGPPAVDSDSESSSAGSSREAGRRARPPWPRRKAPQSPARPQGELDVNSNPRAPRGQTSDSSEPEEAPDPHPHAQRVLGLPRLPPLQVSQDSPEADPQRLPARSRLHELARRMSEKETSSGDEQEAEDPKESLPPDGDPQRAQEEPKKDRPDALAVRAELQLLSTVLQQKYSAVSLCNISTEVLRVINATEEFLAESEGPAGPGPRPPPAPQAERGAFPLGTDQESLDRQLTSLEGNVYLAAGTVYGLEGQLSELEDAARGIHSNTNETELADLEDQVATAAARVHHAELQISDIESRISALTIAGLNIAPCVRLTRKRDQKQRSQVQTIDTSRQLRRKLPAPPVKAEKLEASSVTATKAFNRNFVLQGCSANRPAERKTSTQGPMEPALGSAATH